MATDVIVNKWGFKDYRLHIYGDMEKTPGYSSECQEIIASKGLRDYVVLKGLGNPSVVLQDAVRLHCYVTNFCHVLTNHSGFS
jgi:hypothetical protein